MAVAPSWVRSETALLYSICRSDPAHMVSSRDSDLGLLNIFIWETPNYYQSIPSLIFPQRAPSKIEQNVLSYVSVMQHVSDASAHKTMWLTRYPRLLLFFPNAAGEHCEVADEILIFLNLWWKTAGRELEREGGGRLAGEKREIEPRHQQRGKGDGGRAEEEFSVESPSHLFCLLLTHQSFLFLEMFLWKMYLFS